MGFRLGVDTGGTFTDIAVVNEADSHVSVTKVPSTPDNPSRAIINGVKKIMGLQDIKAEDITFFIHGTTVATNALLELKGAKTALMTTEGFRDILQIGRQTRPSLYDFYGHRPKAIVPRNLRYEVPERVLFSGEVLKPLDVDAVKNIVEDMKKNKVEAVCVCLLHSYANAEHEKMIKEIVTAEFPDVLVTLSSEILPEFREYERMSTVCINGYVMPKVNKYVVDLTSKLKEIHLKSELYIMQSNGGVITAETARESSARTVLSGPAGGALAGGFVCEQTEHSNIITVDMGGTSLDICLIADKKPRYTTESQIGGYPIKLPMIDIHTIGAGGGSIAWIDGGGALRVGPESAGADPGPACYCKGGTEPTVTDANIVLGRLNPEYLLSGEFDLDKSKAYNVIKEKIADPLKLSVVEAAAGIIKVVNANMVRGIRVVSVEKGYDPREFALVPFGGAGPVHGVEMAEELGMKEVIVPKNPGVTSAVGMLSADVRHDYVKTFIADSSKIALRDLQEIVDELEAAAVKELSGEGFRKEDMEFKRLLDMRYLGQAYEIPVYICGGVLKASDIVDTRNTFDDLHFKSYGYCRKEQVVEIVNIRLTALGKLPKMNVLRKESDSKYTPAPSESREVYMRKSYVPSDIYIREDLKDGAVILGPAIVEQLDSTTVIFPNQTASVDTFGNIIIQLEEVK